MTIIKRNESRSKTIQSNEKLVTFYCAGYLANQWQNCSSFLWCLHVWLPVLESDWLI